MVTCKVHPALCVHDDPVYIVIRHPVQSSIVLQYLLQISLQQKKHLLQDNSFNLLKQLVRS